ncbi:MAG TPA: hypothetical protein VH206_17475 [Xanthobacteraceae bacterium]|jgi:hypothetical protein|nr:hypothetical protein [Xanthobacteraceae bacterium]
MSDATTTTTGNAAPTGPSSNTLAPAVPMPAETVHDDLEAYRQFVSEVAAAADGRVIFNRSRAHAAIIIEHIFGAAQNEVNILTGQLYPTVYANDHVAQAAVAFLRRNSSARLNIVSEQQLSPTHPLLKATRAVASDRVKVFTLKNDVAARTPFHFAVADGRSFRFEPKKAVTEAVVQFGAPDAGKKLNDLFRDLQTSGTIS